MWTSTSGPITERRAYLFGFGNGKKGVFPTEMEDGRAGVPFSPYEERFAVVGVSRGASNTKPHLSLHLQLSTQSDTQGVHRQCPLRRGALSFWLTPAR